MQNSNKKIFVTFQKAGYHRYPGALLDPNLSDVRYLGNTHRHLFKFKVWIEVFHDDREIEFHQFLNFCESLYISDLSVDYKSCEMISDDLHRYISQKYQNRDIIIEVSEDGENGSYCEYFKD